MRSKGYEVLEAQHLGDQGWEIAAVFSSASDPGSGDRGPSDSIQEAIRPLWLWSVATIASQVHLLFLYTWLNLSVGSLS